jgi:L-serine deaminase
MVAAKEKGPMDLKKLSYSEREVMTTTVDSFQLALLYRGHRTATAVTSGNAGCATETTSDNAGGATAAARFV